MEVLKFLKKKVRVKKIGEKKDWRMVKWRLYEGSSKSDWRVKNGELKNENDGARYAFIDFWTSFSSHSVMDFQIEELGIG